MSRDEIRIMVRSKLHLKPDQFLTVERDEALEQKLSLVAGKPGTLVYRVSQAGDEIKEHAIIHHIFTDVDPTYIVAVGPGDGSTYRIHGFSDSRVEFNKLMTATGPTIASSGQAEAVADFYREVNPENRSMIPVSSLLDLKQATERQCQTGSFDTGEQGFDAWWKHGKALYAVLPFNQTARPDGGGYMVEWTVLSAPGSGLCGGVPLRARLEVSSGGQIGKLSFSPLVKS